MRYTSFAIKGSRSLLKAMEEELVAMGYKSHFKYTFFNKEDKADTLVSNAYSPNKDNFRDLCAASDVKGKEFHFQLPQQWDEVLAFCRGMIEYEEIKVGDWVICLPGFANHYGEIYGGAGYEEGLVFKVKRIEEEVVWGGIADCGVYRKSVRKATKEEIEAAKTKIFKVGNFEVKVKAGKAFHKNDDITQFIKDLCEINMKPQPYGGKYTAKVKEIIFSQTGCENQESKLSEWFEVYNELTK